MPVPRGACGEADGTLKTFHTFIDPSLRARTSATEFAADIREILCDERSWIAAGTVRWRYRADEGIKIDLLPPDEAERRCQELIGLSVARKYSCAGIDEVVINSDRWYTGAPYDWGSVGRYRRMLINHELGHILRQRHQSCERNGARAPVMMQQSKTMTSDNGKTCEPNPWPLSEELARLRNA